VTDGVVVLGPVEGLDEAVLMGPCVLGHPAAGGDEKPLVLGAGVVIRAYAVLYQDVTIGAGTSIGHSCLVREGNRIAERCSLGSGAHLEPRNVVGSRTRIHSGAFLASATLGEDVFCGPNVTFTDDRYPPSAEYPATAEGVRIGDGAALGAAAVLLPGISVGARALVGAGSVVTRSVDDLEIVAGNPARVIGRRSVS
jgi:acetyltransferase-like isoleucine patch superfamily enzyme